MGSCSGFFCAPGSTGAPAHFSASEPWLFKLAPVVLITLSPGTFTHTDAGSHNRERTAASANEEKKERGTCMQTAVGFDAMEVDAAL